MREVRKQDRQDGRRGFRRPPFTSSIQYGFGSSYYGHAVFEDPKWDYRNLNFDTDVAFGDQKAGRF